MPLLVPSAAMAVLVTLAATPPRPPTPEEQEAFRGGATWEAAHAYPQYRRETPDASDRADMEARLDQVIPPGESKPAGAAAAPGDDSSPDERPADMPGAPPTAAGRGRPGGAEAKTEVAPSPLPTAMPAAAQVRDDASRADDDLRPLFGQGADRSNLNVTAWVGVGVTALLLGTAAFFGASASDKATDINRLLTYRDADTFLPQEYAARADQYEEDLRVGRRDERAAKAFLVAAGATAVASAVLFVVDGAKSTPKSDSGTRAARPDNDGHQTAGSAHSGDQNAGRPTAVVARSGAARAPFGLSWSF